ncbi:MAG: hypothetical protein U1E27_01320 [Kiritimatiellia bacterium]|nr:hypothetical protein [Kiritimatiellia bacterium]
MKKKDHLILGVHITDRVKRAEKVQQVFTEFGALIKTRLGLHEADGKHDAPGGIILIEVAGSSPDAKAIVKALEKIKGVEVQKMVFSHE